MFEHHVHPLDLPLFSRDMALLQRVFDMIRVERRIDSGHPEGDLLAATIIHLYKQGIREEAELLSVMRAEK